MQFKFRFFMLFVLALMVGIVALGTSLAQQEQTNVPINSTSTVHRFADGSEVEGAWATISRTNAGVVGTMHTSDLTPEDVVTMWWVVFNVPQNCSDACGDDDIFVVDENGELVIGENGAELNVEQIEAAQISVIGATGNVIGENGEGHFSAVLSIGENPNVVFGPSLMYPMSAEIHYVLRTHGPVNSDTLDEQIIFINGGCEAEWPNTPCQDVQFAVNQPQ